MNHKLRQRQLHKDKIWPSLCSQLRRGMISELEVCGELPTPLLTVNQLGCTSPLPTVNPVGGVL
jgi:hypothetical protein